MIKKKIEGRLDTKIDDYTAFSFSLSKKLISEINTIRDNDCYANQPSVIIKAIYDFIELLYKECTELCYVHKNNELAYKKELKAMSRKYLTQYLDYCMVYGADTAQICFGMPTNLIQRIEYINTKVLKYENTQDLARVAILNFVRNKKICPTDMDIDDLWRSTI